MSQNDRTPSWHAASVERAISLLDTKPAGLSSREAARRLERHGPNRLPEGRKRTTFQRLGAQLNNLLIQVLIAAALLSLLMGHLVDALVILLVVIVNTGVGFVQEGRAEQALEAIRAMIDPRASVLREGRRLTTSADKVVPGDIVLIEAGDRVPADLRLIRASSLKIQEAVLTGESIAIEKGIDPSPVEVPLGDRQAMAYSGTFVAAGQGAGIAVATGTQTELGQISTMVGAVETLETPLTRQVKRFARQLTVVILGAAALAFLFAVQFRSYALDEAMMLVVGLAVAAIPEGLPAIMTITLAIGVQRMARRHAIIRRLPAVETLGSVSIICSDKTGTLTRNEMTATTLLTAEGEVAVPGVGYAPSTLIDLSGAAVKLVEAALLCNDAELRKAGDSWIADGDPMEGALVTLAMKAGFDPAAERSRSPRIQEIPFDSAQRLMATLHSGAIYIKVRPSACLRCAIASGAMVRMCRSIGRVGNGMPTASPRADSVFSHSPSSPLRRRRSRLLTWRRAPCCSALSASSTRRGKKHGRRSQTATLPAYASQ
jgi:magnesium-transporting ATPase (P-type)